MGAFSSYHWLVIVAVAAIFMIPGARILSRAGYSQWWCLVFLVPGGFIVWLWVIAFVRWPTADRPAPSN
jgi:hypothetical protein